MCPTHTFRRTLPNTRPTYSPHTHRSARCGRVLCLQPPRLYAVKNKAMPGCTVCPPRQREVLERERGCKRPAFTFPRLPPLVLRMVKSHTQKKGNRIFETSSRRLSTSLQSDISETLFFHRVQISKLRVKPSKIILGNVNTTRSDPQPNISLKATPTLSKHTYPHEYLRG